MAMPSASNNDESTIAERPYDEYALRSTSQLHPHRKLADGLRNIPVAPKENTIYMNLPRDLESLARLVQTATDTPVVPGSKEDFAREALYQTAAIDFAEDYLSRLS